MKYRVMATDGTVKDFDTEAEAKVLFEKKKGDLKKAKTKDGIVPSSHIHKCYHDETPNKPCEVIERWEKK